MERCQWERDQILFGFRGQSSSFRIRAEKANDNERGNGIHVSFDMASFQIISKVRCDPLLSDLIHHCSVIHVPFFVFLHHISPPETITQFYRCSIGLQVNILTLSFLCDFVRYFVEITSLCP